MLSIYIALASLIIAIIYFLVLLPLIPLLKIKMQLGSKAALMFYPLSGLNKIFNDSLAKERDLLKIINNQLKKNPQTVVILSNFIHKPVLVWTGAEYIKDIYLDHTSYVKVDPFMVESIAQKGMVLSEGEAWKRQRKFLGTAFTFEKLTSRLPMINQVVEKVSKSDPKTNLNQFTSRITGEVVIHSFFGDLAKGFQIEGKDAQIAIVEILSEIFLMPMNNPFIQLKQMLFEYKSWSIFPTKKEKQLLKRISDFKQVIMAMIEKRIEQLKNQQIENQDKMVFLDLYVTEYLKQQKENKQDMDAEEILHQFITLFFAGTDTTATTSGTCLYYLAQFPEMQEEILKEVIEVVGEQGDIKEEHLNKLVRVNALIQEVLRLRNPAFSPVFRTVRQDKQLLDVKMKKGWFSVAYHIGPGLLDKHFENAQEFDYKRWLNKGNVIKNDNGFIHIPFAAGPRNCIGQHMAVMEVKMIVARLVRQYKITLNPEVKDITFGMKFLYCVEPDNCLLYEERNLQ
ncbi:unnamed protein product (macronuclear) [Paramecium tetraurelia]|uniref:Cytochrome P450 n=1 Tax=Paramecium tetraurelia TaxID=5888 RepID=A0CUN7_PARTE|nr:uncharacterized protein GSPATT00010704001 [Paramecium tetraurelia]CAK74504.1 unnamed protein product [Paramecium tetraurelia]|eukprot:XP_001441901.1 hypothetical protein (macronuclear) [Paramecium tetraurelia strain d4-2]